MPIATKIFSFAGGNQGWAFTAARSEVVGAYSGSQNSTNDAGGTGSLRIYVPVVAADSGAAYFTSNNYFQWSGTYVDLGVPAGAIIKAVRGSFDFRCVSYTNAAVGSNAGTLFLIESGSVDGKDLTSAVVYAAPNVWGAVGPNSFESISSPVTQALTIQLFCNTNLAWGSGSVETYFDRIKIEVEYSYKNRSQVIMI